MKRSSSAYFDEELVQAALGELSEVQEEWSASRKRISRLLESRLVEWTLTVVITLNVVTVIRETDILANAGLSGLPTWLKVVDKCFTGIYVCELVARLYVYRSRFWKDSTRTMDFLIVLSDLGVELVSLLVGSSGVAPVTVLRILRLSRLGRAVRVMLVFPELHSLVSNLANAAKATLWGTLFVSLAVLVWSILSVQILHPINVEVSKTGVHKDCPRCPHAWESVWQSATTITQHILAGDDWGQVSVPIIEHSPWTLGFFVAMLFSANLLIMNLILAVIVQRAHLEQEEDKKLQAQLQRKEVAAAQAKLLNALKNVDDDGSGTISQMELVNSLANDSEMTEQMVALGVDTEDVSTLFELMDHDGTGEVSYKHLVASLRRLQSHDPLQSTIVNMQQFKRLHENLLNVLGRDLRAAGYSIGTEACPNEGTPVRDPYHNSTLSPGKAPTNAGTQAVLVDSLSASVHFLSQDCALKVTQLTELTKNSAHELGRHSAFLASIADILAREHQYHISQNAVVNETGCVYPKATSSTEGTPSTLFAEVSHLHHLGTQLMLIIREAREQLDTQKMLAESLHTCVQRRSCCNCSGDFDFIDAAVQQEREVLQRKI